MKRLIVRRLFAVACATAFLISLPSAGNAQKVYVGSGNGWRQLIDHPDQWIYVRHNADGFYVNFIELLRADSATIGKLSPLFANKSAYYESDSRNTGLGGFPDGGQFSRSLQLKELNTLIDGGFDVSYSSLNYGVDNDKLYDLQHVGMPPGKTRPCLAQNGPWTIGGDIALDDGTNATKRFDISRTDGASTDGPLSLWQADTGKMRSGSYSMVKYAHSLRRLAAVMVAPYNLQPTSQWLSVAQDCVRAHEDAGATPDIWIVFEYATLTPTLPESVNGQPADTITGMAYWLIHHLKDPSHWAKIVVPSKRLLQANTDTRLSARTTKLSSWSPARAIAVRAIDLEISNSSTWLDLSPVLFARATAGDMSHGTRFLLDGADVTQRITQLDGLAMTADYRLWPGQTRHLVVTSPINASSSIVIGMHPNPAAATIIEQQLTLRPSKTDPNAFVATSH